MSDGGVGAWGHYGIFLMKVVNILSIGNWKYERVSGLLVCDVWVGDYARSTEGSGKAARDRPGSVKREGRNDTAHPNTTIDYHRHASFWGSPTPPTHDAAAKSAKKLSAPEGSRSTKTKKERSDESLSRTLATTVPSFTRSFQQTR
jgi:hypothetical protein